MTTNNDSHILTGEQIIIEELPSGCVIFQLYSRGGRTNVIQVVYPKDAYLIIESLTRMLVHYAEKSNK
jgi:hypothetical protein